MSSKFAARAAIVGATSATAAAAANYANGLHPGYADAAANEKAAMDCVEALAAALLAERRLGRERIIEVTRPYITTDKVGEVSP